MRSVFENVSTRIFCIYGELSDIFCLPDTRILNFEEYLVKRLQDLGYLNVVFVSTQRDVCYAVDSLGAAGIDILCGKRTSNIEAQPKEQDSQETLKKSKTLSRFIEAGNGSESASSATKNSSAPKEEKLKYTYQIKDDQLADATHRYMCDVSSPKALVFTSIEDIIRISDQKEGRKLIERFEEWKSFPNENRNICIFLSKTLNSSELQNILAENKNAVLESLFFDNNVFNINSCISIGNPMNDEIRNLFEYLRINGYKYLKEDNTEFTAKLLYNCNEDNLRATERMLCFYCRENGYRQLKDLKELLEQYMKKCGTNEVWLTQECIRLLFPDSGKLYDDDDDPMEKLKTTEGWEPAYHVIKSFIDHHHALYGNGDKTEEMSDVTDSASLTVDRFEPDERKNRSRCKVPNFVLQGPPGVGKTEIAKLIGQILQREGIIKSGHTVIGTRDKLVGEYVGSTAVKTNALIEEAQEGILLVDEVYSIAEKSEGVHISYCDEVFSTLVAAMTNSNYHFCIVFAGYASRMNEVWNMNEGLYSRFGASNVITLNEYKPPLLRKIFEGQFGKKEGVTDLVTTLSREVTDGLDVFFENFFADRDRKDFGNARDINNLVSDVKRCSNYRYLLEIENGQRQREEKPEIVVQRSDFAERESLFVKRGLSTQDIYSCLNDYIGFDFLAKMFSDQLAMRVESIEKNIPYSGPSHMIWAGNPGTGKSTAAQLTAQLYHNLGILGSSEPIYVDASELTSIYANGGASNMIKKIDEACQKNAVLVIEEAYQLLNHGQDAIHALLNRMETDRRNFNLILILYKDKVKQFLEQNSGLSSRLLVYEFPDYNADQLFQIFELICKKNKDNADDACREKMRELLAKLYAEGKTKHGNARIVRQLLDHMKQARYERINNRLAETSKRSVNEIAAARATGLLDTLGVVFDPEEASTFVEADIPGEEISRRFLKAEGVI